MTTRNAEGQQYHEGFDPVTVKIRNREGDNCAAEVQVQDNKDVTYKIKYFAKETGTYALYQRRLMENISVAALLRLKSNPDSSDRCYLLENKY